MKRDVNEGSPWWLSMDTEEDPEHMCTYIYTYKYFLRMCTYIYTYRYQKRKTCSIIKEETK